MSKQVLSVYKYNEKFVEYFDLVKTYEEIILAQIEKVAIYGVANKQVQEATKNLKNVKFNQVGAMFALKAYDFKLYAPEQQPLELSNEEDSTNKSIAFVLPNKGSNKVIEVLPKEKDNA